MWYLPADDLKVSNLFLINRCAVCDLKSFWNIGKLLKEQHGRAYSF